MPAVLHQRLLTAALSLTLLGTAHPVVQAQSVNPMQLFQGILQNQAPASPAPAPSPLLQGLGTAAGPGAAGQAAQMDELIRLLAQSIEQIDEPREIEIGRQLAAVLLGSKPLYADMATQRYVNQLGRWISLQSERPQLPWTFAVIDDPGYNAFAAPGGFVFVTRGLLDKVQDEAELAGILAHEISHVTARHHLQALRSNARAGMLAQLVGSQLRSDLGGAVSAQLVSLARSVYGRGLDQADEYDADRKGVVLAARAGFDPYGLLGAIQQLRTAALEDPLFSLALSTHPPAARRVELLEAAMGRRFDDLSGQAPVTVAARVARFGSLPAATPAVAPSASPTGRTTRAAPARTTPRPPARPAAKP